MADVAFVVVGMCRLPLCPCGRDNTRLVVLVKHGHSHLHHQPEHCQQTE